MTSPKINKHKHVWQTTLLVIADLLFFGNTNASSIAPIFLIVGFLLLVCTSYALIYGSISFARLYGLPFKHKKRLSIFLSITLGLILALQSVGELSLRDVIVLLPLAIIGYIYVLYATTRRRNLDA